MGHGPACLLVYRYQGVEEHALVLGVGHRGGRALLCEQRARLDDVSEVGGMPRL